MRGQKTEVSRCGEEGPIAWLVKAMRDRMLFKSLFTK